MTALSIVVSVFVKWFLMFSISLCPTGYFTQISTLADVQENVMEYLHVLSRPKVIDQEHDTVWTEAYIDSTVSWTCHISINCHSLFYTFPLICTLTRHELFNDKHSILHYKHIAFFNGCVLTQVNSIIQRRTVETNQSRGITMCITGTFVYPLLRTDGTIK